MAVKITDIVSFFETEFADITKQSKWDFSGRQVFTGDRPVTKIALSLDPAKEVIREAIDRGCELLITHHPLFFRPSKGFDVRSEPWAKALEAIRGGLDILSYHTNLDVAQGGLNDYLCELLGGKAEKGCLSEEGREALFKISVFVPYDYKEKVFDAMTKAGAGRQGNYSDCGFMSEGAGVFTPQEGAKPFLGKVGEREIADEVKIETVAEEKYLNRTLLAMKEAHPYEEPAYDVIRLENGERYGFGRVCLIPEEISLKDFIALVKDRLKIDKVRINGTEVSPFRRFALCSGSGAGLWRDALKKGVQVLLTGDMKYHDALDAAEGGVCVIDAGHEATEAIYMKRLGEILKKKFSADILILKRDIHRISWG